MGWGKECIYIECEDGEVERIEFVMERFVVVVLVC